MKKFSLQKNTGITLVALVVTIIVLIILAGISISLVLGNNGIITKAREAREKTIEAEIKERIRLTELAIITNTNIEVNYDELKVALANEFGVEGTDWEISDEEDAPWIIKVGNVEYEVQSEPSTKQELSGLYYAGTDEIILTWEELLASPERAPFLYVSDNGSLAKGDFDVSIMKDKNENSVENAKFKLVVDSSVTTIVSLKEISQLEELILPNTITVIADNALYQCSNLKSVILPKVNELTIGSNAFAYCNSLESIKLRANNKLNMLAGDAFYSCKNLSNIALYGGDIQLDDSFYSCPKITDAHIEGNNITMRGVFVWGYGLKNVTIKGESIIFGTSVFEGCSELEKLSILGHIEGGFGGSSFSMCNSLSEVTYSGTKTEWNSIDKGSNNSYLLQATIHCLDGDISPST